METNETSGVDSDAEKVAKTLETSVAARRVKRKAYLGEIKVHQAAIVALNASIADMDKVISRLEKTASKLRKG